jgi:maltooligosyltrehalose trehalohydrolase
LLSPFIPLLFMGEEYGEDAPFLYFVSHGDPDLISAVREGRKEEFKTFKWADEPPDPQAMDTYLRSKIDWEKRNQGRHRLLREFYRKLIRLRREIPAFAALDKNCLEVRGDEKKRIVLLRRWNGDSRVFCVMNFNSEEVSFRHDWLPGEWIRLVDSADEIWDGPGSSLPERIGAWDEVLIKGSSMALYRQEGFL